MVTINNLPKASSPVIAITGSGGVGKSSLLGELVSHFDACGERVGVLACDPQSPITGGALLGDRCRIAGDSASERIFVSSLATPSGQQGIAPHVEVMLDVMKVFGFNRIFIEAVGAGQTDTRVRSVADIVVLMVQPHTGDQLQWEKAGILEIADMVVVNKCDLAGADQTIADVTDQLQSTKGTVVPVVKTSIARRDGIDEFCRVLDEVIVEKAKQSIITRNS